MVTQPVFIMEEIGFKFIISISTNYSSHCHCYQILGVVHSYTSPFHHQILGSESRKKGFLRECVCKGVAASSLPDNISDMFVCFNKFTSECQFVRLKPRACVLGGSLVRIHTSQETTLYSENKPFGCRTLVGDTILSVCLSDK